MELKKINTRMNEIADKIISSYGKEISEYDELEKQVICALVFGALNASAIENIVDSSYLYGIMIVILMNKFGYSEDGAIQFEDYLVECTDRNFHPVMNTIIHKGITAYDYIENPKVLKENIDEIMRVIRKST
mgnify:FL=1